MDLRLDTLCHSYVLDLKETSMLCQIKVGFQLVWFMSLTTAPAPRRGQGLRPAISLAFLKAGKYCLNAQGDLKKTPMLSR